MDVQTILELSQKEKGKPHKYEIEVTRAVTCPSLKVTPTYGMKVGKQKHELIEQKLKQRQGVEVEVEVDLVYKDVLLKGRLDAIDLNNYIIYEIKPSNIKPSYIRQLSAYVTMVRELTSINFDGRFLIYNKESLIEVVPSYIDLTVLDTAISHINSTVSGEHCSICELIKACPKEEVWVEKFGFEISKMKKLDDFFNP